MVWLGFELGLQVSGAERVEESGEQVKVHAADQAGVVLGQALERAVRQRDAGVVGAWLKAMRRENPRHLIVGHVDGFTCSRAEMSAGLPAEGSAVLVGLAVGRLAG